MRETVVTPAGKAMNDVIDAGREKLASQALAFWTPEDLAQLARLLERLAQALTGREPHARAEDGSSE